MSFISPTTPPTRAIMHPGFRTARDAVLAGLFAGDLVIIVTGPPGTGKTTLMKDLETVLRSSGWHTRSNVPSAHTDGGGVMTDTGAPRALFIDDAKIEDARIEQILRLTKVAVILSAPAGPLSRHQSVAQVDLTYLSASGSADYIGAWLNQAGKPVDAFGKDALIRVNELCSGSPRLLSALLTELTRRSSMQPQAALTIDEVEAAARHIGLPQAPALLPDQPATGDGQHKAANVPLCHSDAIGPNLEPDQAGSPASSAPAKASLTQPALAGMFLGVAIGLFGLWVLDAYSTQPDTASAPAAIDDAAVTSNDHLYPGENGPPAENAPDPRAGLALHDDGAAR